MTKISFLPTLAKIPSRHTFIYRERDLRAKKRPTLIMSRLLKAQWELEFLVLFSFSIQNILFINYQNIFHRFAPDENETSRNVRLSPPLLISVHISGHILSHGTEKELDILVELRSDS